MTADQLEQLRDEWQQADQTADRLYKMSLAGTCNAATSIRASETAEKALAAYVNACKEAGVKPDLL